jgi:hypothetical protein
MLPQKGGCRTEYVFVPSKGSRWDSGALKRVLLPHGDKEWPLERRVPVNAALRLAGNGCSAGHAYWP